MHTGDVVHFEQVISDPCVNDLLLTRSGLADPSLVTQAVEFKQMVQNEWVKV